MLFISRSGPRRPSFHCTACLNLLYYFACSIAYEWCDRSSTGQGLPRCSQHVRHVASANRSTVTYGNGTAGLAAPIGIVARDQFGSRIQVGAGYVVCAKFRLISPGHLYDSNPQVSNEWQVSKHDDGSFEITWHPTTAGLYHITFRFLNANTTSHVTDCYTDKIELQGAHWGVLASEPILDHSSLVGGVPYHQIFVVSGPTNETFSRAEGGHFFDGIARSGADHDVTFYIVARDIYGNQQTSGKDESSLFWLTIFVADLADNVGPEANLRLNLSATDDNSANPHVAASVNAQSGLYEAQYRSPVPGLNKVEVYFGEFSNSSAQIAGSPYSAQIQPPIFDDAVDRTSSVVVGPATIVAGTNITFRVKLQNRFREAKSWSMNYGPLLAAWSLNGAPPQAIELQRDEGLVGEYTGRFFTSTAGLCTVSATLGDDRQAVGSVIAVNIVPAKTVEASLSLTNAGISAGETMELQVASYDRYRNLQMYWPALGYDEYKVQLLLTSTSGYRILSGDLPSYCANVRHHGDGLYLATAKLTISGEYLR
eukprot:SAG31_NODE_1537_length_7982_cov_2.277813_2_plen_539_part_00